MKFEDAVQYMEDARKFGSRLGLERMRELMRVLGDPQDALQFVHIAGTNGKGSVLTYIGSVLRQAGYKTGSYSSPAVMDLREPFQIDGRMISKSQYAECVGVLRQAVLQMQEAGKEQPTLYELETALAFCYFKKSNCDIVVLETGLGGAQDATNIVRTTILAVITSISMDHCALLGSTPEKIAAQKAGIIKPHIPVVMMENGRSITSVIREKCREVNAELHIAEAEKLYDVRYGFPCQRFSYSQFVGIQIALGGTHQIMNAALAIEAFWCLRNVGIGISAACIRAGMQSARWPFRMEQVLNEPQFLVDGAHNPDAAARLAESLRIYFGGRPLIFIMGIFKDKDYERICKITAGMAQYIITVQTPDSERALSAAALKDTVLRYNSSTEAAGSLHEAVGMSLAKAENLKAQRPVIVAFGSLSYLFSLVKILKLENRSDSRDGQDEN
ncbi:MAG: folylpolyglutamate synthase/dihydrofolate synthase family protein [Lachnospiraceae bacterium]